MIRFFSFPNGVWERFLVKLCFKARNETAFPGDAFPNGVWERGSILLLVAAFAAMCGCADRTGSLCQNIILPEQRSIDHREPEQFQPAPIPPNVPPRTVSDPRPDTEIWQLSLDDAIRIGLENANVIRVLAGVTAVSSGQTVYDPAITNTTIDQNQARFDPVLSDISRFNHTDTPQAIFDPSIPAAPCSPARRSTTSTARSV